MISIGSRVHLNSHYLDVRDVLYEMIDLEFQVLARDENRLLTLHSLPLDAHNTTIVMGIEPRLLLENQTYQRFYIK